MTFSVSAATDETTFARLSFYAHMFANLCSATSWLFECQLSRRSHLLQYVEPTSFLVMALRVTHVERLLAVRHVRCSNVLRGPAAYASSFFRALACSSYSLQSLIPLFKYISMPVRQFHITYFDGRSSVYKGRASVQASRSLFPFGFLFPTFYHSLSPVTELSLVSSLETSLRHILFEEPACAL